MTGEAKVREFDERQGTFGLSGDKEEVLGFDIPVDEATGAKKGEGTGELTEEVESSVDGEAA